MDILFSKQWGRVITRIKDMITQDEFNKIIDTSTTSPHYF